MWPDGKPLGSGHGNAYLQHTYASDIRKGKKTVEGRAGGHWPAKVEVDDWVTFKITQRRGEILSVRVKNIRRFTTFEEMLLDCGVEACLPGFKGGIPEAAALYRGFGTYNKTLGTRSYAELEHHHGVVAMDVEPLQT